MSGGKKWNRGFTAFSRNFDVSIGRERNEPRSAMYLFLGGTEVCRN
jgi:hypothetical protein